DPEKLFFVRHAAELQEIVKDGAFENCTLSEIAAGLMMAAEARGEKPGWIEKDGEIYARELQMSMDGTYRNRNNKSRAVNIICAAKLKHKDHRGLLDTVIDHVTACRHTGPGVPLGPVCALSR
ncbi:unnamed protein product, partial [Pylaiella littoralis]